VLPSSNSGLGVRNVEQPLIIDERTPQEQRTG